MGEMAFHDFKRKFERFGVSVIHRTKHVMLERIIGGIRVCYPVAVKRRKVADVYVRKARKRFKLRPEDGISNEEYDRA